MTTTQARKALSDIAEKYPHTIVGEMAETALESTPERQANVCKMAVALAAFVAG